MYRIVKALNHNAVLAIDMEDNQEYILLGKGVGFGKKVSERFEAAEDYKVYSLHNVSEKGKAKELLRDVPAEYLEIADQILNEAETEFGTVDRSILFPMADHIAYAVKRIQSGEQISNPLTDDIRVLFYREFKIASMAKRLLKECCEAEIGEDEIGYIALHVHSCIDDEKVSTAMQMAAAVRECVTLIERDTGKKINVQSLDYNRLMNHIKYMVARTLHREPLKSSMNDYIRREYPKAFSIAAMVCEHLEVSLKRSLPEIEIGYLAMHIERVIMPDLE